MARLALLRNNSLPLSSLIPRPLLIVQKEVLVIPSGLTRAHVLAAIEQIRRQGVPPHRDSTRYCLVLDGQHFPPKYVISLGCKQMTGFEHPALFFNGGAETNEALRHLDFTIVDCHCGGLRSPIAKPPAPEAYIPGVAVDQTVRPASSVSLPLSGGRSSTPEPLTPSLTERVHHLLLSLPRRSYQTPLTKLPENGIYVFFERKEMAPCYGQLRDRIVRVGTHTADGNLRSRIRQHYGQVNALAGNKNGSVFRMHLGAALMSRADPNDSRLGPWYIHMAPSYPEVEATVSQTLRDNFTFACFKVDTKAERLLIEEGLIALLAQFPSGRHSHTWLGRYSPREKIRRSGLWNTDKVDGVPLTEKGLRRLEQLIQST